MVDFCCDDGRVEQVLKNLCRLIVEQGGMIDDRLTLVCKKGSLAVQGSVEIPSGKPVIHLPQRCLLPLTQFRLGLEDGAIVIRSCTDALDGVRREMLENTVALYNLTGKLEILKRESVFALRYDAPELCERILACRNFNDMSAYQKSLGMPKDEFILDEFIISRGLYSRGAGEEDALCFVPVIDCFNHHHAALPISAALMGEKADGKAVFCSRPGPDMRELFVNYGRFDAADTFIFHHFVDRYAPFVRSIPLTVRIPDLAVIDIQSILKTISVSRLPDRIRHLEIFLPETNIDRDKATAILCFLQIPQDAAPGALRQVLMLTLNMFTQDTERAWQAVLYAERQIISENLRHYTGLLSFLESYRPAGDTDLIVQNARLMAKTQIEKIRAYPFFSDAVGGVSVLEEVGVS